MKLTTIRTPDGTRAAWLDGDVLVELPVSDVGALLAREDWRALVTRTKTGSRREHPSDNVDLAAVVPRPSKVICVGHNYTNHIQEMGRELPVYPTIFTKFADSLTGPYDVIRKPADVDALDWEAELAVVIGRQVRNADEDEAADAIAGFTVMNDISARDWQFRTLEWTQGKIWDSLTPLGPYLVTPDELPGGVRPKLRVTTLVNDQVMQDDNTGTLLFDPVDLVRYISTIIRLSPGDIIATGTPGGVGHARDPKRYLAEGETVTTRIEHVGACTNRVIRADDEPSPQAPSVNSGRY